MDKCTIRSYIKTDIQKTDRQSYITPLPSIRHGLQGQELGEQEQAWSAGPDHRGDQHSHGVPPDQQVPPLDEGGTPAGRCQI